MPPTAPPAPPVPAPPVPTPAPAPPRSRRVAGLDALRALAVVLVVGYHLAPLGLPGGFVGVDVFFVVSGFIITTLLVAERGRTGRIDLRSFWVRRARRLLPALVLVLVVCLALAALVAWAATPDVLVGAGRQLLGALTFTSNWEQIASGTSYAGAAMPALFANLWSLAVEEQFYLLWPLVLAVLLAVVPHRWRLGVVLGLAVASGTWMALAFRTGQDPTAPYVATHTHLFGLMLGAALALGVAARSARPVRRFHPRPASTVLAVCAGAGGVAVLGTLVATMPWDAAWTYRGGLLVASLATVGVIVGLLGLPRVASTLDRGVVGWVGRRSYAVYLWHWPLLVLVAAAAGRPVEDAGGVVVVTVVVLTVLLASVSSRWVEEPVRRDGFARTARRCAAAVRSLGRGPTPQGRSRRGPAVAGALAGVAVVALAATGVARAPAQSSLEESLVAGEAAIAAAPSGTGERPAGHGRAHTGSQPGKDAGKQTGKQTGKKAGTQTGGRAGRSGAASGTGTGTGTVRGSQVTVIGDSVTLASAGALLDELPGASVSAAVSRSWAAAPGLVDDMAARGALRRYVVVALATNSTVGTSQVEGLVDAIGRDHQVVLVNAYGQRSWIARTNAALATVAGRHGNVALADWAAAIRPHVSELGPDGIHPGPQGAQVYADVVAKALRSLS